jgi:hypothetical protein
MNKLLILFVTLFISSSMMLATPFATVALSPALKGALSPALIDELKEVISKEVQAGMLEKATESLSLNAIFNFIKNLPANGKSAIKLGFSGIKSIPSLAVFPFKHFKKCIQMFPGKQLAISGYEAGLVLIWVVGAVVVVHATRKVLESLDIDHNNWFYMAVKSTDNHIF